ncbi:hypothetical protein K1719_014945 [Acacia pycnantha]|nr:hypothetical protein K1719_014945 [Acacia pycnantha]
MDGDATVVAPQIPSFKDKLLNADNAPMEDEDEDIVLNQGDVSFGLHGKIPTVDFASHVIDSLNKKMGLTVVVKLLGRKIGFRHLRSQLQALWKPSGLLKIIDLHDDCFLVKFQDDLDYQNALLTGPWMIFGHYLTVQPWTPSFRSQDHVVKQVIGWIRLPKLPARYYHKSIIRSIGGVFGEVIKVDYNTESGDRGKFARIAVMIDLTKPLVSKIQVDGELIFVEYEGLPSICFDCGLYGHLQVSCPAKMAAEARVPMEPSPSLEPNVSMREEQETPHFGAWMQVQRRRRTVDRGTKSKITSGSKSMVNGSRFVVLGEDLDEERPNISEQEKGIPNLIEDPVVRRSKAKETRGIKKASTVKKHQTTNLQGMNQGSTSSSQHYVVRSSDSSLDQSTNSAVQIEDHRMPRRIQSINRSKTGPSPLQPSGEKEPQSRARGIKISYGLNIQKLGSKPFSEGAGPSVRVMKEMARGIQNELESPIDGMQEGIVRRIWGSGKDLFSCIEAFRKEIQPWNIATFREIGKRKRRLFSCINGIQTRLELNHDSCSDFLVDLEISLREDLEEVCFQEELLWLQKSSSDWMCLGDRNTNYYHLKALIRRKRNYVSQLKLPDGTWLKDGELLSSYARQFFVDLFTPENPVAIQFSLRGAFPTLAPHQILFLDRSVTIEEVRQSLFEMKPLKSPGKDGSVSSSPRGDLFLRSPRKLQWIFFFSWSSEGGLGDADEDSSTKELEKLESDVKQMTRGYGTPIYSFGAA